MFRGRNAGGTWNPVSRDARFQVMPDKDAPLWNRYTPVIYWWTADEADATHAYRVAFNGRIIAVAKDRQQRNASYRCVRSVP